MTMAEQESKTKSLPASCAINPTLNKPVKDNGVLFISATYTDKGGNNIKPLTGGSTVALRNNKVTFEGVKSMQGFTLNSFGGNTFMGVPANTGWFSIDSIDLSGINGAALSLGWIKPPVAAHTFEVHLA